MTYKVKTNNEIILNSDNPHGGIRKEFGGDYSNGKGKNKNSIHSWDSEMVQNVWFIDVAAGDVKCSYTCDGWPFQSCRVSQPSHW